MLAIIRWLHAHYYWWFRGEIPPNIPWMRYKNLSAERELAKMIYRRDLDGSIVERNKE